MYICEDKQLAAVQWAWSR